ncbi:hypothetical protein J7F03_33115 [Streptomyces sp. ISL-43]|uniref:type IV toxin-antitoxin system AbiEi family antitoxin domain-containing protein n=1 Tax=Streptomyces sp. ISL-43 TaxID=2819183 RepID=UPI001BE8EE48|nr:type IV toxin-antitoxin system AbiEi family antitoxin domain-containing protein [Streptomyces sp. ISL-43]MBT2451821.1 hypothetical protein [Streptomyces sp. ISL-43]
MRAEQEVAFARSLFESADTRAEISQRVALEAEELLPHTDQDQTGTPTSGKRAQEGGARTLGEELLAFARARRRITRTEIVEHLSSARPDIKITGVGPELTRLTRAGVLLRVSHGTYAIPSSTRGDGA